MFELEVSLHDFGSLEFFSQFHLMSFSIKFTISLRCKVHIALRKKTVEITKTKSISYREKRFRVVRREKSRFQSVSDSNHDGEEHDEPNGRCQLDGVRVLEIILVVVRVVVVVVAVAGFGENKSLHLDRVIVVSTLTI